MKIYCLDDTQKNGFRLIVRLPIGVLLFVVGSHPCTLITLYNMSSSVVGKECVCDQLEDQHGPLKDIKRVIALVGTNRL